MELPVPIAEHLVCDLVAHAEQAGDRIRLVPHRRVGEGEMRLARTAGAFWSQLDVVHMDRFAGEDPLEQRSDLIDDVMPDLVEWTPECGWVATVHQRRIGIVVEHEALWSPSNEHRLTGGKHDAYQRL